MDLKVEPKEVLDAYSTPIVQQTAFWSRVKERLGMHSCAFEYSVRNSDLYDGVGGFARTNADFIMFYQYLNAEDYVAYVPYGPEIEPSEDRQGEFLEELSEVLRSFLPKGCVAIRYDLNWESHWCKREDFDSAGNWLGTPRKEYQEIQLNYGTVNRNLWKSNSNILPANTVVVDLSQSDDEILARMRPKMLASRMECVNPDVNVQLLVAYYDNIPLAAMFLVMSAHRATYLYGAYSS